MAALIVGEIIIAVSFVFKNDKIRFTFIAILFVISVLLKGFLILPFQIEVGAAFAVWLFAGTWIRKSKDNQMVKNILNTKFPIKMVVVIMWVLCVVFELWKNTPFDISALNFVLYGIGILGAFLGSTTCYYVSLGIKSVNIRCITKILTSLGENTIWILGMHSIDMVCFTPLWERLSLNDFGMMIIRLIFDISLATVCKKLWMRKAILEKC